MKISCLFLGQKKGHQQTKQGRSWQFQNEIIRPQLTLKHSVINTSVDPAWKQARLYKKTCMHGMTGLQSSLSGVEQNREDDYKLHQQEDLRPTNTLDPSDLHNTEGNL